MSMKAQIIKTDRNLYFGKDFLWDLDYDTENKIVNIVNNHILKGNYNIISFQENGILVIPADIDTILDIKHNCNDRGVYSFYSDFKNVIMLSGFSEKDMPVSISIINCKKVIFDSRGEFERIDVSQIYIMKNMNLDTFISME